ncbi:unnamed protein product [Peronospora destructor]|uniref:Ribosome biogenesis protein NOP53 n=1 Tax=Peronospora destructor TaxID=86335 RepID=A0AAV0U4X0_9STRA|nr:unnamed protein product [Peronospora destructor]
MDESRKRRRHQHVESLPVVQDEVSSAQDVIKTVAAAWDSNDRYMRRKKREQIHEIVAAQAALQAIEDQKETGDEQKEKRKEVEQHEAPDHLKQVKSEEVLELNSPIHSGLRRHKTLAMDPTPEKNAAPVVMAMKPKKQCGKGHRSEQLIYIDAKAYDLILS